MHISTYTDQGPYFAPARAVLGVRNLTDFLLNVRGAMEDDADFIAVFGEDGKCKGVWGREVDVEYGEGECYDELYAVNQYYTLERDPKSWRFKYALDNLRIK